MSRIIQKIFIQYNTNIHVENRNKLGIMPLCGSIFRKVSEMNIHLYFEIGKSQHCIINDFNLYNYNSDRDKKQPLFVKKMK